MPSRPASINTVISADIAIVGAGFAGISTACHLTRQNRELKVVVIEKENLAGIHSSGRNAGMVRQVTSEETISALARRGARHIQEIASKDPSLFRQSGSLLLGTGDKASQLEQDIADARAADLNIEAWDVATACSRFPVLEKASFELACFCASDGIVDLAALVRHYVAAAERGGAHVLLSAHADEVIVKRNRVQGVRCGLVEVQAPVIVNAAGPWAGEIGKLAGATPVPFRPRRRHVFVTRPLDWVSPDWPFIWDLSTEVYFRPEEGGLLFSPCDEDEPGDKDSDAVKPGAGEKLEEKLRLQFPRLAGLPRARSWSGLRTLTPDGRFVIGPDPALQGFFWVAGLGGHGVTASDSLGKLAARIILDPEQDADNPHSPSRFA
jgi:D-arginine dehydrogenase